VTDKWNDFCSRSGLVKDGGGLPSLDMFLQDVLGKEEAWAKKHETGLGKTKRGIEKFLTTMNDHSYLFSVIPNGDKYTSLITGVVTSVVKVGLASFSNSCKL